MTTPTPDRLTEALHRVQAAIHVLRGRPIVLGVHLYNVTRITWREGWPTHLKVWSSSATAEPGSTAYGTTLKFGDPPFPPIPESPLAGHNVTITNYSDTDDEEPNLIEDVPLWMGIAAENVTITNCSIRETR